MIAYDRSLAADVTCCIRCGIRTTSPQRQCRACAHHLATPINISPAEHGLYGGRWVTRAGVQVWQPREELAS